MLDGLRQKSALVAVSETFFFLLLLFFLLSLAKHSSVEPALQFQLGTQRRREEELRAGDPGDSPAKCIFRTASVTLTAKAVFMLDLSLKKKTQSGGCAVRSDLKLLKTPPQF